MAGAISWIVAHKEPLSLLALLVVSELMPFSESVKSNGIFQMLLALVKKPAKAEADKLAQS
jgi:hypothetical protein